jgi:hypothetical protein
VQEDLQTENLLRRAARGEASALDALLGLHRARLKVSAAGFVAWGLVSQVRSW